MPTVDQASGGGLGKRQRRGARRHLRRGQRTAGVATGRHSPQCKQLEQLAEQVLDLACQSRIAGLGHLALRVRLEHRVVERLRIDLREPCQRRPGQRMRYRVPLAGAVREQLCLGLAQFELARRRQVGEQRQPGEAFVVEFARPHVVVTHQQRLVKVAVEQKIQVLLARQRVGECGQRLLRCLAERGRKLVVQLRVAQVTQSGPLRIGDEVAEQHRFVHRCQVLMVQVAVRCLPECRQFVAQVFGTERLQTAQAGVQKSQKLACRRQALRRRHQGTDVEQQHLAQHAAHVPAGQRVETEIGNTARIEVTPDQAEQGDPHRRRHPGVEAVGNDIVEALVTEFDRADIGLADLDIVQLQSRDLRLAGIHLGSRQIESEEPAARQKPGHRDQVRAAGAAQLEHPAGARIRTFDTVQAGQHGKVVRVGFTYRQAVVWQRLVGVQGRTLHKVPRVRGGAIVPAAKAGCRQCRPLRCGVGSGARESDIVNPAHRSEDAMQAFDIKDPTLASQGVQRIEWAWQEGTG